MRLWTVVLFVIGLNVGFSILNYSGIWCSWNDYAGMHINENGPVPYNCPGAYTNAMYANSTALSQNLSSVNPKDVGWGLLAGLPIVNNIVQAGISFTGFLSIFTGIFTSIGDLMQNVGFPPYISWGLQGVMDIVIFYGLLQFILGRSGKTVE
jgi:hypothetical protein